MSFCKQDCVLGDEGHCSRTKYEHDCHCEKRMNNNDEQIRHPSINEILNTVSKKPQKSF